MNDVNGSFSMSESVTDGRLGCGRIVFWTVFVGVFFVLLEFRYFGVNTLKELFENVESRNIVAFIKDINFYHCI